MYHEPRKRSRFKIQSMVSIESISVLHHLFLNIYLFGCAGSSLLCGLLIVAASPVAELLLWVLRLQ